MIIPSLLVFLLPLTLQDALAYSPHRPSFKIISQSPEITPSDPKEQAILTMLYELGLALDDFRRFCNFLPDPKGASLAALIQKPENCKYWVRTIPYSDEEFRTLTSGVIYSITDNSRWELSLKIGESTFTVRPSME